MAFDSKKTILLEKTYLYVRASLGFQLEGTSTEKIPTNNGFYRFFVDNLQKAIGNSYVNILYDSQDLTLQCFCSDLYMDELMSSDSSAIEDVVEELKKNTTTIIEFENGVSSALSSNHQDNVALNAKIEEFESGVSSAMAANHEDNVTLFTGVDSIRKDFKSVFLSRLPLFRDDFIPVSFMDGGVFIDSNIIGKLKRINFEYSSSMSSNFYNFKLFGVPYFSHGGFSPYSFFVRFPHDYKTVSYSFSNSSIKMTTYFDNGESYDNNYLLNSNLFVDTPIYFSSDRNISFVLLSVNMKYDIFQYFVSICPSIFSVYDVPFYVSSNVTEFLIYKDKLNFIPCSFRFKNALDITQYVSFRIPFGSSSNVDFLKNSDVIFYFSDGSESVYHLYEKNVHLSSFKDSSIVLGNFINIADTTKKLLGFDIVFTGVSSAS